MMNPIVPQFPPGQVPPIPMATLQYSSLASRRTGVITVIAVIGIVMASLGFIASAFGAISVIGTAVMGRAMPTMRLQSSSALTVAICDVVCGVVLAAALMTGSIGLLRLRAWSRRVLLWWAWIYLASVAIFLLLQILIVVPSQVAMVTSMMAAMPTPPPATMPATTMPATTTTSGGVTTVTATSAAMTPAVGGMMKMGYTIAAVGKSVISVVFPIAILIIMQRKAVRSALAPAESGIQ